MKIESVKGELDISEKKKCHLCTTEIFEDELINCNKCGEYFCSDCTIQNKTSIVTENNSNCLLCNFFSNSPYTDKIEKYWFDFRHNEALFCDNCFNEISTNSRLSCNHNKCNGEFCKECYSDHKCISNREIMERRIYIDIVIGACFENDLEKIKLLIECHRLNKKTNNLKYGVCILIAIENKNIALLEYILKKGSRLNEESKRVFLRISNKLERSYVAKIINILIKYDTKFLNNTLNRRIR